ncbi:MAG: hypothetical protein ACTTKL_04535 [Treponema sp.]
MKKRTIGALAVIAVFAVALTGCTHRLGAFTVISTRNIDWSRAGEYRRDNARLTGEDLAHIILVFPTKIITIEDAVDKALDKVPGAVALVDAVLRDKQVIGVVYQRHSYIVEGSVLIDPKLVAEAQEESKYYIGIYDGKKDVQFSEVSQSEYARLKTDMESSKTVMKL